MADKIYPLSEEECYCIIPRFFEFIAKFYMQKDTRKLNYDCSKIYVSTKVQNKLFEYMEKEERRPNYEVGMIWVCYGPKTDETLTDYQVRVQEGFLVNG